MRYQARAAYDATVASYRQTTLSAFEDVEDNLAAWRLLQQESQEQDAATASAEKSLQIGKCALSRLAPFLIWM